MQSWGLPGYQGCQIWEDWLNRAGGLLIQGRRYPVRIIARDCGDDPDQALVLARELVWQEQVSLLMLLGGDYVAHLRDLLNDSRVLASTLLPSDLSPDMRYLIAPSEVHPVYNVTGVDWIGRNCPQVRRVALCSQRDGFGVASVTCQRLPRLFAASAMQCAEDVTSARARASVTDVAAIVQPIAEENPDFAYRLVHQLHTRVGYHAMTEYAHATRVSLARYLVPARWHQYERLVARHPLSIS